MSTVLIVSICIIGIVSVLGVIIRRKTRQLEWQINAVARRLARIVKSRKRSKEASEKLLKEIYSLITKAVNSKDQAAVYKTVDVLKLALGEKIIRCDETMRLMSIIVTALKAKEVDSAAIILEAFRPLIYQMPAADMKMAVEQLTLIGAVALKERQPFIAAKVSDAIFSIVERLDDNSEEEALLAALRSVRIMGVLVLRRKETALFREINARLINWVITGQNELVASEMALLYSVWLYRIVKADNLSMFNILLEFAWRMFDANCFTKGSITLWLTEWGNIAGMAALNPYSKLASYIIEQMLLLAAKQHQLDMMLDAVHKAGYVIRLSISQHGIKTAFSLLYYLLETGRKMFVAELKFGEHSDGYRKAVLLQILKENIALLTYSARQDIIYTTGDMIAEVYKCWVNLPKENDSVFVNQKSVKKFCQLLLLFWLRTKRHPEKNMPADDALIEPMLISEHEKKQLGFVELRADI
ncbi:MAG: hypothetical protein LLG02_00735 [Pelosinus sp.]|nr:hypothetical protein [Pelosinus sp.]